MTIIDQTGWRILKMTGWAAACMLGASVAVLVPVSAWVVHEAGPKGSDDAPCAVKDMQVDAKGHVIIGVMPDWVIVPIDVEGNPIVSQWRHPDGMTEKRKREINEFRFEWSRLKTNLNGLLRNWFGDLVPAAQLIDDGWISVCTEGAIQ